MGYRLDLQSLGIPLDKTDLPLYTGHISVGADAAVDTTGPFLSSLQSIFGEGTTNDVVSIYESMTGTPATHNTGLEIKTEADFTGNVSAFGGLQNTTQTKSSYTGDLTIAYGLYNSFYHKGSGNIAILGVANPATFIHAGTGIVTDARAFYSSVSNTSTGTISAAYGFFMDANGNSGGGTITTNYGLYINQQTAGSTNYNIYSAGLADNYFDGYVRTSSSGGFYMNAPGSINNRFVINTPTTADAAAECLISPSSGSRHPLVLQAHASQAVNIFEVQTSAGALSVGINSSQQIIFGAGGDVNLYRSTTDTLKTDDDFVVGASTYALTGIYGGTATSDPLDLYANSGTLGTYGGEQINIHHGIKFDETFTIENDGLGGFSNYVFRHLDFGGTYTIENGGNVGDVTALWADYTVKYSNSQAIAAQSVFDGRPTIQPTAAVSDNTTFSMWRVFTAIPTFAPDLSTAITATTDKLHPFFSAPQVALSAGSHASAQAVVTNISSYRGLIAVAHANATVTNGSIFHAETAVNSGTLTNMYQFRADSLTVGSTNRVAARFDSPSSGATFGTTLWLSGNTDATTELGGIVFGSSKDTNLYRSAANKLKTDDDFEAASWTNLPKRTITVVLDGGGSVLTTGAQKAYVSVPYTGTITKWRILALDGNTGSITLDIWKDTYANFAPTDADSITASDQPTISSANKNEGSSLTGWTTSITEGDILEFNIDSVSTFTKVKLELFVEATS